MIVKPKYRGFICLTSHPTGCAKNVEDQINYVKMQAKPKGKLPKNVLVIGGSTGYGLASRIQAAFGCGAATLNVSFEKEAEKGRTATAGFYNNKAFDSMAQNAGLYAKSINGDAFSKEIKQEVIDTLKKDMGPVDLLIYSLASPRRTHPITGEQFKSVLKPIGEEYCNKTVDFHTKNVSEVCIDPATEDEIRQTIAVMGGEDWEMWIDALADAGLLAQNAKTLAYSYIGPELTHPIYLNGSIGAAKSDLERAAKAITQGYSDLNLQGFVAVNKGVVTQASSAIPVVPLYMSALFKVMRAKGIHEDCIEQMNRMFVDRLYAGEDIPTDLQGRIRMDDWEMREDVQQEISSIWKAVDSDNVSELTDIDFYSECFFKLFGFGRNDVDYELDVEV